MANFNTAFKAVIGIEGGYVNDPNDLGGETKYGISKRSYPHLDIKNLTLEDAAEIYLQDFWNIIRLGEIKNDEVAEELFEQAVNCGPQKAVYHAQLSLQKMGYSLVTDGVMGPTTLLTLNRAASEPLLKCLNGFRFMWYVDIVNRIPNQQANFVGWLRRVYYASRENL